MPTWSAYRDRYATESEGSLLKCSDSMKRSSRFQLIWAGSSVLYLVLEGVAIMARILGGGGRGSRREREAGELRSGRRESLKVNGWMAEGGEVQGKIRRGDAGALTQR